MPLPKENFTYGNLNITISRKGYWGGGVYECSIDYGPGYRVYFGRDGKELVILVGGGTKKRQASDINDARSHWADYKKRKKNIDKGG